MSVQKLKIFKKSKGAQSYSKNPILDSLIKQKLQSQMIIIKDNFHTLIHREDAKQKQIEPQKLIKKRRLSTHNLASITSEKIKESVNFHHQRDKQVFQFIINRQKSSPFMEKAQVEGFNSARTNYDDLTIKIKQSNKVNYQLFGKNHNSQLDQEYHKNLRQNLKKISPKDIWLLEQPQVQEIIKSKSQNLQLSPLKLANIVKINLTHRPSSSQNFDPLKGSRHKVQKKILPQQQIEITYDPFRFHKNDYTSLQRWFESTLDLLHKRHQKQVNSIPENYEEQLKRHYNGIYSVYVSTLKEVIRLTYIQSSQKGLLMQKMIWSFIRLFQQLIQEQHKLNYEQFKQSSKEINELRKLYEERIQKLQSLVQQKQQKISTFNETKKNIILSCLSYQQVNKEMNDQIEILTKQIKTAYHQNNFLMKNLNKLISQFQKREIIKIQKLQKFNLYYYLNQKNCIQVVAKVPKEEILEKFFEGEMKQAAIHNMEEELSREITKVDKLENQLTLFWQKKRNYLEIDKIIEQNAITGIDSIGIQVDVNGPNQYLDHSTQFPEEKQQSFAEFLKKQLVQERQTWCKKQVQFKEMTVSLKQLYDQARQSITYLSTQNLNLKQTIDQKDNEIIYLKRKIEQLQQKVTLFGRKITILQKNIEEAQIQEARLKQQIKKGIQTYNEERKKGLYEKQNNNILVSNNFRLKEKVGSLQKQFEQLEGKIKNIAPSLQQMMVLAQTSENAVLLKLSSLVQANLSKYVEKDAQVFLTH